MRIDFTNLDFSENAKRFKRKDRDKNKLAVSFCMSCGEKIRNSYKQKRGKQTHICGECEEYLYY